jgi:hypothetical protein
MARAVGSCVLGCRGILDDGSVVGFGGILNRIVLGCGHVVGYRCALGLGSGPKVSDSSEILGLGVWGRVAGVFRGKLFLNPAVPNEPLKLYGVWCHGGKACRADCGRTIARRLSWGFER